MSRSTLILTPRTITVSPAACSAARASSSDLPRSCGTAMVRGVGLGGTRVGVGGTGVGEGGAGEGVGGTGVAVASGAAVGATVGDGTATGLGGAVGALVGGLVGRAVGSGVARPSRLSDARPKKPAPSAARIAANASNRAMTPPLAPRRWGLVTRLPAGAGAGTAAARVPAAVFWLDERATVAMRVARGGAGA